MNPHELLVRVQNLRLRKWDQEDLMILDSWSNDISTYEALEILKVNPIIQKFVESKREEVKGIDYKLSNERKLSEDERHYLFAKKEVLNDLLSEFDKNYDDEITRIDQKIGELITFKP